MSRKYKRSISVIIGDTESINVANALKISGLRTIFKIEKENIGSPNNAKISIYNLSEESRSKIEKENTKIVINAGYENNEKLMFAGDIYFVFHNRVKENIITEIYAGDGHFDYVNSFLNKTYSNSATYKNVAEDVVSTFKQVKLGNIEDLPNSNLSLFGTTYSDSSHNVLDNITKNTDTSWFIDNELLNIVANKSNNNEVDTVFNSTNGMISVPIITEIGINLIVLLQPDIKISSNFRVESQNPNIQLSNYYFRNINRVKGTGTFRILKILHIGDTHGQPWNTNIEGVFTT